MMQNAAENLCAHTKRTQRGRMQLRRRPEPVAELTKPTSKMNAPIALGVRAAKHLRPAPRPAPLAQERDGSHRFSGAQKLCILVRYRLGPTGLTVLSQISKLMSMIL